VRVRSFPLPSHLFPLSFKGRLGSVAGKQEYELTRFCSFSVDGCSNKTSVFTLLVVASSPPLVLTPVSSQLNNTISISSAVRLPSNRGVLVHPYYSFSLGFVLSTIISPTGAKIYYAALTTTSTSLPSWLTFDNTTATFNGVAPASGSWDIVMVGSTMEGFGDVRQTLNIEVGTHALDLVRNLEELKGIVGSELQGAVSTQGLRLDGLNVTREEVEVEIELVGYEWLSFDS
jgi:axial budding pattern protein 2